MSDLPFTVSSTGGPTPTLHLCFPADYGEEERTIVLGLEEAEEFHTRVDQELAGMRWAAQDAEMEGESIGDEPLAFTLWQLAVSEWMDDPSDYPEVTDHSNPADPGWWDDRDQICDTYKIAIPIRLACQVLLR